MNELRPFPCALHTFNSKAQMTSWSPLATNFTHVKYFIFLSQWWRWGNPTEIYTDVINANFKNAVANVLWETLKEDSHMCVTNYATIIILLQYSSIYAKMNS